jgi:DNA-binding NtrC family response regulator
MKNKPKVFRMKIAPVIQFVRSNGTPVKMKDIERQVILFSLKWSDGDKPAAAKAIGMSKSTFYRKLNEIRGRKNG